MKLFFADARCLCHPWALLFLLCISTEACGGTLAVTGEFDVLWNGGASPEVDLRITNPASTGDEDLLAYQLELRVIASPSATGLLQFNTATLPTTNYVFDGRSLLGPAYAGPPATLIEDFLDIDLLGGRTMTDGESAGLVTLNFDDSLSPSGLFFIELVPFDAPDGASWYSAFSTGGAATAFGNESGGAGPLVVGSVVVGSNATSVPEPNSLLLAVLSAGLIYIVTFFRINGEFHFRCSRSR